MRGDPAGHAAQVAERALVGMAGAAHGRAWAEAVRVLVISEHYDAAGRELERAQGGTVDALSLRAALRLRTGDLPRALADARRLHALASVSGHPPAVGCAAALLAAAGVRPAT